MTKLWDELSEKIKGLAGSWASFATLGSFVLYLLGYLSLRFHLTVLGIGTDLAVLDERYLFAGAKFLVYLVSSIPIVILLLLMLALLLYLPFRILPKGIRDWIKDLFQNIAAWWSHPNRLALTGIIFSVLMIQLVMRQSFFFSNLLLAPDLPGHIWMHYLLLDTKGNFMPLYFSGLVAGTAIAFGFLFALGFQAIETKLSQFLRALLGFLAAVQVLMLPVNYGILITDKMMPRVEILGEGKLEQGEDAWLVWEGKEGMTYLVRTRKNGMEHKALVTLPRKDLKETRIIAYDHIFVTLFANQESVK